MAKAQRIIAEAEAAGHPTTAPALGDLLGQAKEAFAESVAGMFDPRADVIDPGGADFRHPPPLIDDPAIPLAERAARDAARAPYRAERAPEVVFTRFATTGRDQLPDLATHLAALRPDRVFGVHRVPERAGERPRKEEKAYMEWEIVHAPDARTGTPQSVDITGFSRQDVWARRGDGDPEVLDEDMVGVLVARAGLDPADCFGLTRVWEIDVDTHDQDALNHVAHKEGVAAVTRRDLLPVLHELAAAAPLEVGPPPFAVVLLDWEAIAAWNQPKRLYPPRVPAPLPHLPSTPQELLLAYLEVVGLQPQDCYAASPTRTTESPGLGDLGPAGVSRGWKLPKQPCADGQERVRLNAAEHVLVAYRDAPQYAAGRDRWAAYEREVLHARLASVPDVREPMHEREVVPITVMNALIPFGPMSDYPLISGRTERELGPYC